MQLLFIQMQEVGKASGLCAEFLPMDWIQFPALRSQELLLEAGVAVVFGCFPQEALSLCNATCLNPFRQHIATTLILQSLLHSVQQYDEEKERTECASLSLFHGVHVSPTCRSMNAENSVRGSLPLILFIFVYAFPVLVWPVELRGLCSVL